MPGPGFFNTPEALVGGLAILGLICVALCAAYRGLLAGQRTPDPWSEEVEQAVESPNAVPLCPHCLTPQQHEGWFCPECGSTVGPYVNYLPSVYIFSIGEATRGGVERRQPWNALLVVGYVLLAVGQFSILAPVYCLFLFLNRFRNTSSQQTAAASEG
jgi:hypothetical protein